MRALQDWFATWRAAESPTVAVTRVPWPELEQVLRAAAALRPFAETSSVAADALASVFGARRILTCTPLPPSHELAGLARVIEGLEDFLAARPDHSLCTQVQPLAAALHDLSASSSPVAAAVAGVLGEYGGFPDARPEAVLVVPRRRWLAAVRAWLSDEEFDCVDVACLPDLRTRSVAHEAAVLVGHPATAFSSAFRSPDVAVRECGWVLTAPAAEEVRFVLTADTPALPTDEAWLLTAQSHPRLRVRDSGPRPGVSPRDDTFLAEAPAPARRTPRPPTLTNDEELLAVEVQLASGHAVFFHSEIGPRPHVVAVDDEPGAVALSAVPVSAVKPGVLLAVRAGAAPHAEVVARASGWLRDHRGWSPEKVARVRGLAADLKAALRGALAREGYQTLHRRLARTQGDDYAHVLLRNPLDEDYIAPQRRAGFDALTLAIGAEGLRDHFDDLAAVRTAHQQAGEEIRRDLLARLRDRRWLGRVDDDGWAVLHAGDLGSLLLAVITAHFDEPVPVARTWLGGLVTSDGHRVTTLVSEEGT